MADRNEARNPKRRGGRTREGRRRGPRREERTDDRGRGASPVPGPGTEGAEEGYHSMHAPEERRPDVDPYNVAPPDMPPSPAGADADIGAEAAASRRMAGLPDDLARRPEHRPGQATPGREPFLGYDALTTNDVLDWISDVDPEPGALHRIRTYEAANRRRDPILQECDERLRRLRG